MTPLEPAANPCVRRSLPFLSTFVCVALSLCLLAASPLHAETGETFAIDYIVSIVPRQPASARVRWELSGINEIKALRLRFAPDRLDHFAGSGTLEPTADGLRWIPGGPYAHLTYRVKLNHLRGRSQRYDSYAAPDWVVTRARDLFPRIAVTYEATGGREPRSHAQLIFHLPSGWQSAAPYPEVTANTYRLTPSHAKLDRPRGWVALGKFALHRQDIAGIMVSIAALPGSSLSADAVFRFFGLTLPALKALLQAAPQTVLVVSAPDPMWHGGISAEHSFFMHAKRPLRTPDKTSPFLHEMFHVLQPYQPAADADWIEEGLAEFYSLELQRRAGLIDTAAYARALAYFERFGLWHVDLTQQQDNAATNNSAPLVLYALDQHIQHATAGRKRLDDVVARLAQEGGRVDSARLLRVVNRVSGKKFTKFFERHVRQGEPPSYGPAP